MEQKKIGAFIARRRKEHRLTQAQLAEKLGVTDKAVSKWETGRCLPDASLIEDVCLSLDITIHEFFAGERLADEEIPARAGETMIQVVSEYQKQDRKPGLGIYLLGAGLAMLILAGIRSTWEPWAAAAAFVLAAACCLLHGVDGWKLRAVRAVSLAMLAVSVLCAVDLGLNYANAAMNILLPEQYDGSFTMSGVLGRFAFGDSNWSLPRFFQRFCRMVLIAAAIGVENIVLACISAIKGK